MSWLGDFSDVINRQGQARREAELRAEERAIAALPDEIAALPGKSTDHLLDLWRQSMDRSGGYMTRKRTRALYRLLAIHAKREILRRTK